MDIMAFLVLVAAMGVEFSVAIMALATLAFNLVCNSTSLQILKASYLKYRERIGELLNLLIRYLD
jgi:Na+/glutamate symporter